MLKREQLSKFVHGMKINISIHLSRCFGNCREIVGNVHKTAKPIGKK